MSDDSIQPDPQQILQAAEFNAETRSRLVQLEATVERLARELGKSERMASQELDSPTPRFRIFPAAKTGTHSFTEQVFLNASGGLVNLAAAQARTGTLISPPPDEAYVLEVEDGTTKRFLSIRETGSIDPVLELTGSGIDPDVITWEQDIDNIAVSESPIVRTYLDTDGTLYGYQRRGLWDSIGGLWNIAEESRYVIAVIPTVPTYDCADAIIEITPSYDSTSRIDNVYTQTVVKDVAYTDEVVIKDFTIAITCNDDGTIGAVVTPNYVTVSKITSITYVDAVTSVGYTDVDVVTGIDSTPGSFLKCPEAPP